MAQILIVERDSASADLLQRALGRTGHHLEHTPDYRARLAAQGAPPPELIVAVARPDLAAVMPLLREARALAPRPAVIVLGERRYEQAVAAFRAGAADYLHTPCSPATLEEAVEAVLVRRVDDWRHMRSLQRLQ